MEEHKGQASSEERKRSSDDFMMDVVALRSQTDTTTAVGEAAKKDTQGKNEETKPRTSDAASMGDMSRRSSCGCIEDPVIRKALVQRSLDHTCESSHESTTAPSRPPSARRTMSQCPGAFAITPAPGVRNSDAPTETAVLQPEPEPAASNDVNLHVDASTTTPNAAFSAGSEEYDEEQPRQQEEPPVAHMVDSSRHIPLQEAEEYDQNGNDNPHRHTKGPMSQQWKINGLLAVIFLLIVVIILQAILLPNQSSSSNTGQRNTPTTNASTASASQAPTSTEAYVLSVLPLSIPDDPESPQARALDWLLQDPKGQAGISEDRIKQRYALATLYFATDGDTMWNNNSRWLDYNVHECDWYTRDDFGNKKAISRGYPGYLDEFSWLPKDKCNREGLLEHLWLDQNNLMGTIPEELYLLTSLKTLSYGINHLHGAISTHIGKLTRLEALGAHGIKDGGRVPSELGLLTNLQGLGLSDNNHEGAFPTEIWQLQNLATLLLYLNPLMTGTIPTAIGMQQSNLRWFTISDCGFTGTLPTELGQLQKLEWFNVAGSHFSGTLPSQLGNFPRVGMMSLERNLLEGNLPTDFGRLATAYLLSLHNNGFTGTIPSQFGLLTSLQLKLDLHGNGLSGTIPTQLGQLTIMQKLLLQDNQLSGQIPSQLGQIKAAGSLDFGNNLLQGAIPDQFDVLPQGLFDFNVEGNANLVGTVPLALCNMNQSCLALSLNPVMAPCDNINGLTFDCTGKLCGCDCACSENTATTDADANQNS